MSQDAGQQALVDRGKKVLENYGCVACHSLDGSDALGPAWKGMYGRTQKLANGDTVVVDEAYIIESIADPNARIVQGYPPVMPAFNLGEEEITALLAFARWASPGNPDGEVASTGEQSVIAATESAGEKGGLMLTVVIALIAILIFVGIYKARQR